MDPHADMSVAVMDNELDVHAVGVGIRRTDSGCLTQVASLPQVIDEGDGMGIRHQHCGR